MSVPESKRALRWEESKISGAAAGRCGFGWPKEAPLGGTQESKPLGGTFWVDLSAGRIDAVLSATERPESTPYAQPLEVKVVRGTSQRKPHRAFLWWIPSLRVHVTDEGEMVSVHWFFRWLGGLVWQGVPLGGALCEAQETWLVFFVGLSLAWSSLASRG